MYYVVLVFLHLNKKKKKQKKNYSLILLLLAKPFLVGMGSLLFTCFSVLELQKTKQLIFVQDELLPLNHWEIYSASLSLMMKSQDVHLIVLLFLKEKKTQNNFPHKKKKC